MSLRIVKSIERPLTLISAVLLFHIGGAVAGDSAGGVQQQMSELLAGKLVTGATQLSEQRGETMGPAADVQEFTRRLLSGVTDSRVLSTQAMARPESAEGALTLQKGFRDPDDAQAMAQRLFLGQRYAVAAGS